VTDVTEKNTKLLVYTRARVEIKAMTSRALVTCEAIESENWGTNGFSKAIEQGCSSVVIDLDTNFNFHYVKTDKLASNITKRYNDLTKEVIKEYYISYKGKAIMIPASIFGDGNLKKKSKWIESIKLRLEELDIIAHKKSLTS